MHGIVWCSSFQKRALAFALFLMIFLSGCLGNSQQSVEEKSQDGDIVLEVWHTFAAESKEEEVFMNSNVRRVCQRLQ